MYENKASSIIGILLEDIQTIIDQLDRVWARRLSNSADEEAQSLLDMAEALSLLRAKIRVLQEEWSSRESEITRTMGTGGNVVSSSGEAPGVPEERPPGTEDSHR